MGKTRIKRSKIVSIVAGGVKDNISAPAIRGSDVVIGVDRGALWLLERGIVPDLSIGDFDSVSESEKKFIQEKSKKFKVFPSKKDETDLELAIDECIRKKPKEVRVFGATGTRFDHSYAAVQMLLKLASYNIYGEIVDNFNKIFVVRRYASLKKDTDFPYISLFPLETKTTVSLSNFSYPLTREPLPVMSSRGVSNEISHSSAKIIVHSGLVLVVRSRDAIRR